MSDRDLVVRHASTLPVRKRDETVTPQHMGNQAACPNLLVFSDDWGRHPSSCQHLIGQLVPKYPVWWINTIGMRPPSLNWDTVARGCEKLRHWLFRSNGYKSIPDDLQVVSPTMWPWFSAPRDRWINQKLLTRRLKPMIEAERDPTVAVTTIPIVADLVGRLPVSRWVYYCVDDFSVWPGLDQAAMEQMERALISKADASIAASETLQKKLAGFDKDAQLLTHGVDLDFWQSGKEEQASALVRGHERPLVIFWGVLDRRMDNSFVRKLANDMSAGTILLVGPSQDPDPFLLATKRVTHIPQLPLSVLPSLAMQAAVLVMPYEDLPVTRAMQPLKLKEYLATGRPVVVSDLPSTRPWADCLDIARTADEFSALVRRRMEHGLPDDQRRSRQRLTNESWDIKAREFEQLVLGPDYVTEDRADCGVGESVKCSQLEHSIQENEGSAITLRPTQ